MTDTTEVLRKAREHLTQGLRLPTMPFPDPGAHSMEAYARAVHSAFCAVRFKVIDALAAIDEALAAPAAADGEPVAWCELAIGGKSIAYFDGKPMVMVGPVGNDCHPVPLVVRAAAPSAVAPQRVYLVATGETHEGRETYTRHDTRPALCDAETLYTAPGATPGGQEGGA